MLYAFTFLTGAVLSFLIHCQIKKNCNDNQRHLPHTLTSTLGAITFLTIHYTSHPHLIQVTILLILLITVSLTDFYERLVPNKLLIAFGLPILLTRPNPLGAITIFSILFGASYLSNILFKKATLGGGDMKLYFIIGLVLPLTPLLTSLLLASTTALIYMVITQKIKEAIPFVPFITIGTITALVLL